MSDHNEKTKQKGRRDKITEAFSKEDHTVLSTSEIAEYVDDDSRKSVRQELDRMNDEGILGHRKPNSQLSLWWMAEEVKEPLRVRYPSIQLVEERLEFQFALFGVVGGVIAAVSILTGAVLIAYDVSPALITSEQFLLAGMYAAAFSVGMIAAAAIVGMMKMVSARLEGPLLPF